MVTPATAEWFLLLHDHLSGTVDCWNKTKAWTFCIFLRIDYKTYALKYNTIQNIHRYIFIFYCFFILLANNYRQLQIVAEWFRQWVNIWLIKVLCHHYVTWIIIGGRISLFIRERLSSTCANTCLTDCCSFIIWKGHLKF